MRTDSAFLAAVVALALGAGLTRIVDHRAVEPVRSAAPASPPAFADTFSVRRFLRGNLHTHTTQSDGDSSPADVARWYERRGYAFLAITDHNVLTRARDVLGAEAPGFTLVPGEEVSMWVKGKQVHVNALCIDRVIPGGTFDTATAALEHAIDATLAQGGVALVNHPNFDWALSSADVTSAHGEALLEIASGHPYVHTAGDGAHESHERLWDDALSRGRDVMGVAVDDVHHLVTDADPEAFPGVGWVEVFDSSGDDAGSPSVSAICDALVRGALYASTGAALKSLDVRGDVYAVEPADEGAEVVFVGKGGGELSRVHASGSVAYVLHGGEGYVRARVESPYGTAWTPAVRVAGE